MRGLGRLRRGPTGVARAAPELDLTETLAMGSRVLLDLAPAHGSKARKLEFSAANWTILKS